MGGDIHTPPRMWKRKSIWMQANPEALLWVHMLQNMGQERNRSEKVLSGSTTTKSYKIVLLHLACLLQMLLLLLMSM